MEIHVKIYMWMEIHMCKMDLVHLPEWTFDRKRINVFPLTLTLTGFY